MRPPQVFPSGKPGFAAGLFAFEGGEGPVSGQVSFIDTFADSPTMPLDYVAESPEWRRMCPRDHRKPEEPDLTMSRQNRDNKGDDPGTGIVTKTRPKTQKPSLYKVLLLNDDYTPMDFVIYILERFFAKGRDEATRIMLHVHQKGVGICGVYTYEVAETKVAQVMNFARQHQHPLQCTLEKD